MRGGTFKNLFPPSLALALYNVESHALSHIGLSLNPTKPVLPNGIFRCFWAVAFVCIGASPNEEIHLICFDYKSNYQEVKNVYLKVFKYFMASSFI